MDPIIRQSFEEKEVSTTTIHTLCRKTYQSVSLTDLSQLFGICFSIHLLNIQCSYTASVSTQFIVMCLYVHLQVMHIRYYERMRSSFTDPSMMKGWEAVFDTKDQEKVERELNEDQIEHSWGDNDSLRIVNRVPAVEKHPQTGNRVWFNHLMV